MGRRIAAGIIPTNTPYADIAFAPHSTKSTDGYQQQSAFV
jgi:hypothetical protein